MDFLADPHDGGALSLHTFEGRDDQTRDGILQNEATGRWYVIQDGIPTLFVDGLRPDDSGFVARYQDRLEKLGCEFKKPDAPQSGDFGRIESERRARDEQAEDYDRMLSMKLLGLLEVPQYKRALSDEVTSPLLEAGCGTGRLTHIFAQIAPEVVAVDMSRESLVRNHVRHHARTFNLVYYVHADLTHLPLKNEVFGRCAHAGVYEHIPSRELRLQFLSHARRTMKSGGKLMLSAYRYGGLTKLFEKEGEHEGGIPFFRFTPEELRAEVETAFKVEKLKANLGIYMSMVVARA
jgi:SAM-dependent methyltransferase